MAFDVPTREPTEHQAGTTLRFDRTLSDFPASDWTLAYSLRSSDGANAPIEITATADGNTHSVSVTAADSQIWNAGEYLMIGYVTEISGDEVYQVYRDLIQITPWLGGTEPIEWRTYAQRMLALIESVLSGALSRRDVSYSINGHSFSAKTDADLLEARAYFKAEVAKEQNGGRRRKILTRFKNAR